MERDLALIRAKRAERERAAGALEQKSGAESGDAGNVAFRAKESEKPKVDDVSMLDVNTKKQSKQYNSINSKDMSNTLGPEKAIPPSQELPRHAISIDTHPLEKTPFSPDVTKRQNTSEMAELNLETPSTANLRDPEFENMFNDTENAGGNNVMDFDLTFSGDPSMRPNALNDTLLHNVGLSNRDVTGLGPISSESISTILPGFENYVNIEPEFPINDAPMPSILPQTLSKANKIATSSAPQSSGTTESKFENILSDNFATTEGSYGMGGEGNIEEINFDDWFKKQD